MTAAMVFGGLTVSGLCGVSVELRPLALEPSWGYGTDGNKSRETGDCLCRLFVYITFVNVFSYVPHPSPTESLWKLTTYGAIQTQGRRNK
jgi:hypothetical protein